VRQVLIFPYNFIDDSIFVCCFLLPGFADRDPSSLGIPSDAQYMQEYCQRAGIPPVDNWNFYMAFSFFRVAAILQGVYKRGLQGLSIRFPNKGVSPWHVTSLDLGRS